MSEQTVGAFISYFFVVSPRTDTGVRCSEEERRDINAIATVLWTVCDEEMAELMHFTSLCSAHVYLIRCCYGVVVSLCVRTTCTVTHLQIGLYHCASLHRIGKRATQKYVENYNFNSLCHSMEEWQNWNGNESAYAVASMLALPFSLFKRTKMIMKMRCEELRRNGKKRTEWNTQ